MTTHVLRGSKQEIAETLVRFDGVVRKAIIFVEDRPSPSAEAASPAVDIFEEMRPFMVGADDLNGTREAIDTRIEGE